MDVVVIDLEVNKEFNLISIIEEDDKTWVVMCNQEYGHVRQEISKIKFVNSHLPSDLTFTLNDMKKCWEDSRDKSSKMIWNKEWIHTNKHSSFEDWYKNNKKILGN